MRIRFTKLDDRRHVLEIDRSDRPRERVELETRSTLFHDLTHLAVERAGGIEHGFFGSLAAGKTMAELRAGPGEPEYSGPMLEVERTVALLQRMAKGDESPAAVYAAIVDLLSAQDAVLPCWFTLPFVTDVHARLRQLVGRWNATPRGKTMEVDW